MVGRGGRRAPGHATRHPRRPGRPSASRAWRRIWFEVEATAYVGGSGRTHVRVETEYELLLTNRLVLQPLVEFEVYGRADPDRGIGAGLSTGDAGTAAAL